MTKLSSKVAIITGASRGIGAAVAFVLAHQGYGLVLGYEKSSPEQKATQEQLEKLGAKIFWVQGNVANPKTAEILCQRAEEGFGRLDCVIANAGKVFFGPFAKISKEELDELMAVNQLGVFYLLREAGKIMKKNQQGVVVTISSGLASRISPMYAVYAATKAFVETLTKAFALEYANAGIRANVVAPGITATEMNRVQMAVSMKVLEESNLLGKIAKPEDIAKVVAFMCSDEASHMNGQVIHVDGGLIKGI